MVSTRGHPREFPPPDPSSSNGSPSKASPRKSQASNSRSSPSATDDSPYKRQTRSSSRKIKEESEEPESKGSLVIQGTDPLIKVTPPPASLYRRGSNTRWSHTPSLITLAWLTISIPLVVWDCTYVLLRPHTMPGGKLHDPIWKPYALYGEVDYFYGLPALKEGDGFTAAQGWMNVVETMLYLWYLWIVYRNGAFEWKRSGRGVPEEVKGRKKVNGREAGVAVLIGFTSAIMTLAKSVLYWLNEHCSDWRHTSHNPPLQWIFLFAIPNGAWIIGSAYMSYVFGAEILEGLAFAAGESKHGKDE